MTDMVNTTNLTKAEVLALLRRSETKLDVLLDVREDAGAGIAAQLDLGVARDSGGVAIAEALARTAGLLLLGHHRSDQEVASLDERLEMNPLVTLDTILADAVEDATNSMRRQQWEKYEGDRRPYDAKKAARKYEKQNFASWNALWVAAQQIGVYSLLITDTEGVTTHVYIAGENKRDQLCSLLRKHGSESVTEIVLLGLLDHFMGFLPRDEADRAVHSHLSEQIERHEEMFRKRCQEHGWEYEPTLQFAPCGHHDKVAGTHTRECYLKMADLLECVSDYYLHPALYRHKWRGARTMRYWGDTDPNAQDAKSRLNLMAFFGPEGRVRVAHAYAAVLSRRGS